MSSNGIFPTTFSPLHPNVNTMKQTLRMYPVWTRHWRRRVSWGQTLQWFDGLHWHTLNFQGVFLTRDCPGSRNISFPLWFWDTRLTNTTDSAQLPSLAFLIFFNRRRRWGVTTRLSAQGLKPALTDWILGETICQDTPFLSSVKQGSAAVTTPAAPSALAVSITQRQGEGMKWDSWTLQHWELSWETGRTKPEVTKHFPIQYTEKCLFTPLIWNRRFVSGQSVGKWFSHLP